MGTTLTQRSTRAERREERDEQAREARRTLGREQYGRYLTAAEALVLFVGSRTPLKDAAQNRGERTRLLREQGSAEFAAMSTAEYQVRLLAGESVVAALDAYEVPFNDYLRRAIDADDPSTVKITKEMDEAVQALVRAMRAEQSAAPQQLPGRGETRTRRRLRLGRRKRGSGDREAVA